MTREWNQSRIRDRAADRVVPTRGVCRRTCRYPAAEVGVDLAMREVMRADHRAERLHSLVRGGSRGRQGRAQAGQGKLRQGRGAAAVALFEAGVLSQSRRERRGTTAAQPAGGSPSDEAAADSPGGTPPQNADDPELEPGEMSPILEKEPEPGVPVRIRLVQDVFEGEKQLLKTGDEFAIADQFENGEVAIDHPTEGGIIVEVHEFEVIQWQQEQTPMTDPQLELRKFLGCSESQLASFVESGIESVEELCNALCHSEQSENLKILTAIKGVGKKKAEKILELVKSRR